MPTPGSLIYATGSGSRFWDAALAAVTDTDRDVIDQLPRGLRLVTALPSELPALPGWRTPVIAPSLILAPGPVPISISISIYGDDVWSLAPLIANLSASRVGVDWSKFPDAFQEEMRLAAWMMINTALR
ncbi:hypothetical protein [Streptomyces sp. TRM68367]|uniref:hypothetical protein n=1 Tax=Streptomyces sp. TRM68367 TaxID=2758415 RepID=UPI00165C1313|nr:hypothetical protein [Streptomyces sp. TRM68367]MBC9725752.1 hypothetical protein [Streptomyces sp. TRM68367]